MARPAYLWDYDLDEADFQALLSGQKTLGRLDRDWATVRLLEYAPYSEIVRRLGFAAIVEGWPAGGTACARRAVGAASTSLCSGSPSNARSFSGPVERSRTVDKSFYFQQLYPLQDEVLKLLTGLDTGLYLTGGTAASRGYLAHR
jgi:hypothetical protein